MRVGAETGRNLLPCPGCGALFPGATGKPHAYIGASAGCWALYEEILAKEYGEYRYPDVHRLTVDTYAVQHPGIQGQKSAQSVCVHLVGMYLVLESGANRATAARTIRRILSRNRRFEWLHPPERNGSITVLDVRNGTDLKSHTELVHGWARSVWAAWSQYHQQIFDLVKV